MEQAGQETEFVFRGRDATAQGTALIWILGGGAILPLPIWLWPSWGFVGVLLATLLLAGLISGLGASIAIAPDSVTVSKTWFRIPYRTYQAERIDQVSFNGDWGDEDGATGVRVELGGKEVDIGSPSTMRELHRRLEALKV